MRLLRQLRRHNDRRSAPVPEDMPRELYVSACHPGMYLPITKCGSTFMLNLWYRVEHGEVFADPDRIRKATNPLRGGPGLTLASVQANPCAFLVVRNPVDRFFSLYFDKLSGGEDPAADRAAALLGPDAGGFDPDARSPSAHRANCRLLIAGFERSNADLSGEVTDPHWVRQAVRVNRAGRTMRLAVLTLEGLEAQLQVLLGDRIPDLADHIAAVKARNTSSRKGRQGEVLDDALRTEIERVYARDLRIWRWARRAWAGVAMTARDPHLAPRLTPQDG